MIILYNIFTVSVNKYIIITITITTTTILLLFLLLSYYFISQIINSC